MYSIIVITLYYGTLPDYFYSWIKSCEYNPTIDFLVVTDQKIDREMPVNVKVYNCCISEIKSRIEKCIGTPIWLENPRKLCDFKPIFGLVFSEYTSNYDFWGCCDIDLVFGDIRKFITEEILEQYDKIMKLGHISLYRNNDECNNRYKCPGARYDYKDAFVRPYNVIYDEVDYNLIYKVNGFKLFDDKDIFLDIIVGIPRMIPFKKDRHERCIFAFRKGKVYQCYYENGIYHEDEYMYIHFSDRSDMYVEENIGDAFYISGKGIYSVGEKAVEQYMEELNSANGLYDFIILFIYIIKEYKKKWRLFLIRNKYRLQRSILVIVKKYLQ